MSDRGRLLLYRALQVVAWIGWIGWGIEALHGVRSGPWAGIACLTLGAYLVGAWWTRPAREALKASA